MPGPAARPGERQGCPPSYASPRHHPRRLRSGDGLLGRGHRPAAAPPAQGPHARPALVAQADEDDDLNWAVSVDPTIVRAHQHAAGARKKGAPAGEPADHAIGRSRGGLTTKIHLASDAHCRPLAFVLTAGQAGDAPAFAHVMARLRVPRRRGRPRTRPDVVLADKAYFSARSASAVSRAVIPVPADQRGHRLRRGSRGGRPPAFDREVYKQRNTVERCINRLKQWRGIATRYEKTATI